MTVQALNKAIRKEEAALRAWEEPLNKFISGHHFDDNWWDARWPALVDRWGACVEESSRLRIFNA